MKPCVDIGMGRADFILEVIRSISGFLDLQRYVLCDYWFM